MNAQKYAQKTLAIDARMISSNYTGIGRLVYEFSHLLAKKLPKTKIYFFTKAENRDILPSGDHICFVEAPEKHYSLAEQTTFRQKLYRVNADYYYFPHFNLPWHFNKPYTVTIHDLTLHKFPLTGLWGAFKQKMYQKVIQGAISGAQNLHTVSHNTKKDVLAYFQGLVDEKDVFVAHNGVSFLLLDEIKTKSALSDKKSPPYLFYSGNWKPHKNIPRLFEAFSLFSKDFPHYHLKLTGNPTPEGLAALKKHGILKKVDLLGHVSEKKLQKTLKNAKAYVFASLYEGFGLPPLEAMAAGVPTVVSRGSSLPEVCGEASLYVDPYDTEDIAAKMKQIVTDEALRRELIAKGKAQQAKYRWEDAVETLIQRLFG